VECIANHIMDLCSVVRSDNPTPFFFLIPIKGMYCLKHGFIPQHEHGLAADLTPLKPVCLSCACGCGFKDTGSIGVCVRLSR